MIPAEGAAETKRAMLDEMGRMSRHLWDVVERQQSDDGRGVQAIAQLLRVQERRSRLIGLDAPALRAVDVITHELFMQVIGDVEADVARMEAELAISESRDASRVVRAGAASAGRETAPATPIQGHHGEPC
jgi:hypothetical protein